MYDNTSLAYRLAAFVGAGSVTAAILGGLALIAQPTMPAADVAVIPDVAVVQEAAAQSPQLAATDNGTVERLHVTVIATRRTDVSAVPVVQKKAECPVAAAHASYVRSLKQPAAEADRV
jgi:hypothetical protein